MPEVPAGELRIETSPATRHGAGMKFLPGLAALAVLVLSGCASTNAPLPSATPKYLQTLSDKQVTPATFARIQGGRVLTYGDVLELVKREIPGDEIVAYLRSTKAPYNYTQPQIDGLLAAGADSTLINYVGRSEGDFLIDAQNEPQQAALRRQAKFDKQVWQDPYFTDPGYWGAAPFPYMFPGGWY